MKRILFLRNKIDTPERYNYALNYGWVDRGASEGLYAAFGWDIEDIPTQDELNAYLSDNEIDCIISLCAVEARFAHSNAMEWMELINEANVPTILRAADPCYHSWDENFYQIWDYILYNMPDKRGFIPENGAFIPWCIDMSKYVPVYGGDQIVMACTASEAYPLRMALRELNKKRGGGLFLDMCNMAEDLHGKAYVECLQNSRAIIATGSIPSPETKGKVIEAAACGALVITSPTTNLDRYFNNDQVFVFETGEEFVEVCERVRQMPMDEVIERQKAAREHVSQNHNCVKFINDHILPAVYAAKEPISE